ncbi:hypothetical protein [Paenibacillus illinoisensis]|uniref:hypothetical protein n=1 Tax=Paenibacillus illinoisensis TaxID=59845 RepID=UPI00203BFD4C|nr:hypothetical protein [Paenibacillus illinoisensis]MCM3208583.1 hypothetical protein [Paenibacillus illinoisensis]
MERQKVMEHLINLYEEVLNSADVKLFLKQEKLFDESYILLQSQENESYSQIEQEMLKKIYQLNTEMQLLIGSAMNRMKRNHDLSPQVSRQYERLAYTESFFFDKKH